MEVFGLPVVLGFGDYFGVIRRLVRVFSVDVLVFGITAAGVGCRVE